MHAIQLRLNNTGFRMKVLQACVNYQPEWCDARPLHGSRRYACKFCCPSLKYAVRIYLDSTAGYESFLAEFLTAISTMLIVVTTATGNVLATAVEAFLGGMVTEGLNAMSQPGNYAQKNLSTEASDWAGSLRSHYTDMWKNTIDRGHEDMLKLFDHGVFLAQQDIPIVSPAADNQITLGQVEGYVLMYGMRLWWISSGLKMRCF
ncbi:uncharacterized protein ATNIH1004_007250 [Aspergillus tanneri]|uniref:Uncharacterized protein n=1 Tax=Aspergillus tanneri TaxID=1220188 RepID=A0A5M9MN01_9EURO|nr:uncharacterized protein ATNIH1004_007250 [Aspergillus tanneri]KAA8645829.1 hypothetical protein ATNIH1004_007250 [Aspergillus tanneri]